MRGCLIAKVSLCLTILLCRPLNHWKKLSTTVISCEAPSPDQPRRFTHQILDSRMPSIAGRVGFNRFFGLRTSSCDQYYSTTATTIFLHDFLLTLADEVSRVTGVPFAKFIAPPVKGRIRLAGEEVMGYVGRPVARCTAFVDDLVAFAIFLTVCSLQ